MAVSLSESSSSSPRTPPQNSLSSSILKHFEQVQPLAAYKVRWYYQEDGKWLPFNGADSLNIENAFRRLNDFQSSASTEKDTSDLSSIACTTVRGRLYEADILDRECRPLFWRENSVDKKIKRGTWFIAEYTGKWEAFDEDEATVIEEAHMQFVNTLGLGGVSSPLSEQNFVHQIKIGSSRIEWHDISEVYLINESTGSRLVQKIGLSGPRRLSRGYEFNCDEKDCMGPITHIVFLVHGIGQLYYGEGGIINSRTKFIKAGKKSESETHAYGERVEFFPIEWRTKLKLDEGIIDSITPDNLSSLRKMLNATTMDVLYYASPLYREEIIQTIREKINLVYKEFCDRNPSFQKDGGKVSIIAHSLGSVIIHDMLTLWNAYLLEKDKMNADSNVAYERPYSWFDWRRITGGRSNSNSDLMQKSPSETKTDSLREELHDARLKVNELEAKLNSVDLEKYNIYRDESYSLLFKVENVFNIGSPLGVFLAMRGIRPREDMEQHLLPTSVCKRTLNIYDPADPIAYRLEPLIFSHYSSIPPVRISEVNSTDPVAPPAKTSKSNKGWLKSLFGVKTQVGSNENLATSTQQSCEEMESECGGGNEDEILARLMLKGKRVLTKRIDYVLEASMVEYFSAITSHQAYWHNTDFAKFVLQVILAPHKEEGDIQCRL